MKKIFVISLIFITLSSTISVLRAQTFRVEGGYSQPRIYSSEISHRFLHGINLGVSVEIDIPQVEFLSLHTGLSYSYMFGVNSQKYFFSHHNDSIRISTQGHQLRIPIHLQASQTVFRVIRGTVFAGPSINIGLAMPQTTTTTIRCEEGLQWLEDLGHRVGTFDLYDGRLRRFNLQLDAGLGLEWWNLQLRGGYSLGLNNLSQMDFHRQRQSGWFVSLGYRF